MDVFDWLTCWYQAQCDGDWEHSYGVRIDTLDNPGWTLTVDLSGTDCDGRTLDRIQHNYEHPTDWWTCWTEDNSFRGAGGPLHLRSLLETFRTFATDISRKDSPTLEPFQKLP
ncbi:immunity 53 family protein [Ancylobacter sp. FA202]|uniref:immunity 53 family protein n=1 Tax=Ancylobacter sp. FA202 TaxID=1111106 RepID=UPI00036771FE|nr:immunity 53 family protein [Ancylobacter sp. FA202]